MVLRTITLLSIVKKIACTAVKATTVKENQMRPKLYVLMVVAVTMSAFLMMPLKASSDTSAQDEAHMKAGHQKVEGVVTDVKSGLYTVKTPTGTVTLSEKSSSRHGHGVPKVGDEMTLWLNESNMVIDAHPKGQAGKAHRFLSGKLTSLDNAKSEIKLSTSEGDKSFKIKPETRTFVDIAEGTPITIELNENGEVIDFHKDQR